MPTAVGGPGKSGATRMRWPSVARGCIDRIVLTQVDGQAARDGAIGRDDPLLPDMVPIFVAVVRLAGTIGQHEGSEGTGQ